MKLSRKDIVAYFRAKEAPACFTEHPLLRYLQPLPFDHGIARIGSLLLHLDEELGLVYTKETSPSQPEAKE